MAEGKKSKAAAAAAETARPQNASVGEMLRAARAAKGLELEDVSSSIHIRAVLLKAIEDNHIEALPGMTYAVGFVRSYANFLGLNGAEVVHKFKAEHGHETAPSKLVFPEPIAESRMPDPIMVGVGAFLAIAVLVAWTLYSTMQGEGRQIAEQIPSAPPIATAMTGLSEQPEALKTEAPKPAEPLAAEAASAPPALAEPVPAAKPETPVAEPAPATPTPVAEAPPAAVAVVAPPSPAAEESPKTEKAAAEEKPAQPEPVISIKRGKTRVTLKANQASWIQISDSHGGLIFRKVLRPGEQYAVPDQAGMTLVTANAGGFDILVDGQQVQPVGKPGEIVRGISLDPDGLKKRKGRN